MSPAALPVARELIAPVEWTTIDFLSDLHLAEDTPLAFEAWRDYLLGTHADAIFLLGDLFEVWVGDDARHGGFEARCIAVLREAASRRWLGFMAGNRDFLVGAEALAACGVTALADPTVLAAFDRRLLLSHGDALCIDDVAYQRLRAMVRDPAWQTDVLARPIAERREMARHMRAESERHQAGQRPPHGSMPIARRCSPGCRPPARPTLIPRPHTHRPGSETLAPRLHPARAERLVARPWRAGAADVLRWQRSGIRRLAPDAAGS